MSRASSNGDDNPPECEIREGIAGRLCESIQFATKTKTRTAESCLTLSSSSSSTLSTSAEKTRTTHVICTEMFLILECPGVPTIEVNDSPLAGQDALTHSSSLRRLPCRLLSMFPSPSSIPDNPRLMLNGVHDVDRDTSGASYDNDCALHHTASPPPGESFLHRAGYVILFFCNYHARQTPYLTACCDQRASPLRPFATRASHSRRVSYVQARYSSQIP